MMPMAPLMIERRLIERAITDIQLRLDGQSLGKAIDPAHVEVVVDFLQTCADGRHHGSRPFATPIMKPGTDANEDRFLAGCLR